MMGSIEGCVGVLGDVLPQLGEGVRTLHIQSLPTSSLHGVHASFPVTLSCG